MANDEPLYRILGILDGLHQTPSGWEARCPGPNHKHDDKHPSLTVGLGGDGRVLLKCHAGCDTEQIVSRLGMNMKDLFPQPVDNVRRIGYRLTRNGKLEATHRREEQPDGSKKMWWERNGKNGLGDIKTSELPLYGVDILVPDNTVVIVCEGEKAAQALQDAGIPAVGTVTGASGTPSQASLAPLKGHEVWLWPDADTAGQDHMRRVAELLETPPRWIDWAGAPAKGDAADYLAAGLPPENIHTLLRITGQTSPKIERPMKRWTLDALMREEFDPLRWAVPRLLPAGLFILAGKPKLGKSGLLLNISIDIARGRPVLGHIPCEIGDTLVLALEESAQRMQTRSARLLGEARATTRCTVAIEWPRADLGGIEEIEQWIREAENPRLIVVDTYKRFRPPQSYKNKSVYDTDYDSIIGMTELAMANNVAIVLVFHTNKTIPDDPMDMISGSLGLSGAADGVLVLKRERGQATASLFVTGRDVEEQDLALRRDDDDMSWALLGDASMWRLSQERRDILDILDRQPGMRPAEIADALGWQSRRVRKLLFSMVHDSQVRFREQKYFPPVDAPPVLFSVEETG